MTALRLQVPRREHLIAGLAATNRRLAPLFVVWPVGILVLLATTRWTELAARPIEAVVAAGVALASFAAFAAGVLLAKHRWVDEIPPDRQLGLYRRADLVALVDDVHRRMGLSVRTPVAIAAEKSLNASAMRFGLAWLLPRLNAVYLHRPMLHVLSPGELASVVGHELGHYHRHEVHFARATALHLVALTALNLWVLSHLPSAGGAVLFGLIVVDGLYNAWLGMLNDRHMANVEFLCDDTGAQVAGVLPAMSAELKLALDMEATLAMQRQLAQQGKDLPLTAVLEAWERAQPYGQVDEAELKRRLAGALQEERAKRQGLSLAGYLEFISGRDAEAEANVRKALAEAPEVGPLLTWDREGFRARGSLTETDARALVDAIERGGDALLVAVPWESDTVVPGGSHPTATRRLLYLWHNREGIASAAARVAMGVVHG